MNKSRFLTNFFNIIGVRGNKQRDTTWSRWVLPVMGCLLFVYYTVFSIISKGFYQHDEIGHLVQITQFWQSPLYYLTDVWARGGFKILYAIPGLFGYHAIIATNILFTVLSAYLAYRVARLYQLKYSWLAMLFTGLQPFVINLSFRCYSEIPAMFFTTLFVYLYIKEKHLWAALVCSYLFTIRSELAIFALIPGVYFLVQKKWVPLLCLGVAPVILNVLGWIVYNAPLYILHTMVHDGIQQTYQRMGFWYFWLMLPEISGIMIIFLFIVGLQAPLYWGKNAWEGLKKFHAVLIVFTVYFLMHCAFTSQSFGFGRSGGVGRFMLVVLPMIAVIAVIGINFLVSDQQKWYKAGLCSIGLLVLLVLFWKMETIMPLVYNGYITIHSKMYNISALACIFILGMVFIFWRGNTNWAPPLLAVTLLLYTLVCVHPVKLIEEDRNLTRAVSWLIHANIHPGQVYSNHIVASYTYGKETHNLSAVKGYDLNIITKANKGDVFIYETHYTSGIVGDTLLNSGRFNILKKFSVTEYYWPAWIIQKK